MNKKLISQYKNGNYNVLIYSDGTKIRVNNLDNFKPDFAESMDMKISNFCPYNCPMCHENSNDKGKLGKILNNNFVKSLHEGTELAIGGGAVTYHPDLAPFLKELKTKNIIPSITVNQREFETNFDYIKSLVDNKLIYGLGVSFVDYNENLWNKILEFPNVVVHLIAGYHNLKVFKYFAEKKAKILILGYKIFRRGEDYFNNFDTEINSNILDLKKDLKGIIEQAQVVSFDNLAIKQLDLKSFVSEEYWNEFYMGDDGDFTMYVDMVEEEFAKSSTSTERYKIDNLTAQEAFNMMQKVEKQ